MADTPNLPVIHLEPGDCASLTPLKRRTTPLPGPPATLCLYYSFAHNVVLKCLKLVAYRSAASSDVQGAALALAQSTSGISGSTGSATARRP